jgi:hypothetical protein
VLGRRNPSSAARYLCNQDVVEVDESSSNYLLVKSARLGLAVDQACAVAPALAPIALSPGFSEVAGDKSDPEEWISRLMPTPQTAVQSALYGRLPPLWAGLKSFPGHHAQLYRDLQLRSMIIASRSLTKLT